MQPKDATNAQSTRGSNFVPPHAIDPARPECAVRCCNPDCEGDWGTGCYCCHGVEAAPPGDAIDREVEIVNLVTDLQSFPPEMWTDATDSNDEGRAWHAIAAALYEMGWRRG